MDLIQELNMYDNKIVIERYTKMLKINGMSTINMTKRLIKDSMQGYYRVLDIGCGLSPLLQSIRQKIEPNKLDYVGIDSSTEMIKEAKKINLETNTTKIKYIQTSIQSLLDLSEFPWYNVVILQSFIHLLLDKDDITKLCKLISKILPNEGTFYISTKLNISGETHIKDDIYLVEKHDSIRYKRRIFTQATFDQLITSVFENEDTYELETFIEKDDEGNIFYNLIGRKDSLKLYQKYKYSFGYNSTFKQMKAMLDNCANVKEYVDNPMDMQVIRKEGFLLDMFYNNNKRFNILMKMLSDIFQKIMPGKYPVYMKDKLNMNKSNWKFKLHQDAGAGWKNKLKYKEYVTIGIIMGPITSYTQGPTRIGIRQNYQPELSRFTEEDKTLDESKVNSYLGKPLQYLNCFGTEGNYFVFDQYVLHDSNFNLATQHRDILFITCAISENPTDMLTIDTAEQFYNQKTVLDKKTIQGLLSDGYTYDDFLVDVFGKVIMCKGTVGKCNFVTLC